jgi:putative endonuclease
MLDRNRTNAALFPLPARIRHSGESRNPATLMKQPYVYILASKRNGTLYLGVTSNLSQRVSQHKNDLADGFSKRYQVHNLVWYELHGTMQSALHARRLSRNGREPGRLS